jgi:hypothetical protein
MWELILGMLGGGENKTAEQKVMGNAQQGQPQPQQQGMDWTAIIGSLLQSGQQKKQQQQMNPAPGFMDLMQ